MRKRRFKVTGTRLIGPQGRPVRLAAGDVRTGRGWPGGFGYSDHVRAGWRMRVWPTDASRERYRRDAISDI